jgi:hypothetical protein
MLTEIEKLIIEKLIEFHKKYIGTIPAEEQFKFRNIMGWKLDRNLIFDKTTAKI